MTNWKIPFKFSNYHVTSHAWKECPRPTRMWVWKEKEKALVNSLKTLGNVIRIEECEGNFDTKLVRSFDDLDKEIVEEGA